MTDRKQEVIEIFRSRLAQARGFQQYDAQHGAECLYDLTAPLMGREFPEEKLLRELWMIRNSAESDNSALVLRVLGNLKRLWESQTSPARPDFPAEKFEALLADKDVWSNRGLMMQFRLIWEGRNHIAEVRKKGTCQTCGGSGSPVTVIINSDKPARELCPCPDCDGTGEERRSGEERREGKRRDRISDRRRFGLPGVETYGNRRTDRRILEDRRKVVSDGA